MTTSARDIYQTFLDDMSTAIIERDIARFVAGIHLPHRIITDNEVVDVLTPEDCVRHAEGFADALRGHGIDAYTRVVQSAEFQSDTKINGTHISYMTAQGKLVVPKFENKMELELRNGVWGSQSTRQFTRYVAWPDLLPRGTT